MRMTCISNVIYQNWMLEEAYNYLRHIMIKIKNVYCHNSDLNIDTRLFGGPV